MKACYIYDQETLLKQPLDIAVAFKAKDKIILSTRLGSCCGNYNFFYSPSLESGEFYQLEGEEVFGKKQISYRFSITPCAQKIDLFKNGLMTGKDIDRVRFETKWNLLGQKDKEQLQGRINKGQENGEITLKFLPPDSFILYAVEAPPSFGGDRCFVVTEQRYYKGFRGEFRAFLMSQDPGGLTQELNIGMHETESSSHRRELFETIHFSDGHALSVLFDLHAKQFIGFRLDEKDVKSLSIDAIEQLCGRVPGVPEKWTPLVVPSEGAAVVLCDGQICDLSCEPDWRTGKNRCFKNACG